MRIAVLFAIGLNLVAGGGLALTWFLTRPLPWPLAWPVAATILVMSTAWAFVIAMRRIGAPLSDIVAAAGRVGNGDLTVRLDEEGLPWLRSVAAAFNTMTARLDRQQREREALMADIAHELRTPVAVIQGRVEGMLDGIYPPDEPHVRQVLEETRMLARLVEDLRTSAHAESGTLTLRKETTDLGVLIEDVADAFAPHARSRNLRIDTQLAPDVPMLHLDPHRIREVLVNLVSNALRHSADGGLVEMTCHPQGSGIAIHVMDRGSGIPPADLPRIFERFYKEPGSTGSGLGLTIAKGLVSAHGGTIAAHSRQGGGTVITVVLPTDTETPGLKTRPTY